MNDSEKESLKEQVHLQTMREIQMLGNSSLRESVQLQKNIARLSKLENERYSRVER
jgi:ribosomal protein L29